MVYRFFSRQIGANVELRERRNSTRISMRVRNGDVCLTVPFGSAKFYCRLPWNQPMVDAARLLLQKERQANSLKPKFELDTPIVTPNITILVKQTQTSPHQTVINRYDADSRIMTLEIGFDADIADDNIQRLLRLSVRKRLKQVAEIILKPRLVSLSALHGFQMSDFSFSSATTRWGSCSSRGKIMLSGYLCLLPDDLIDYVIVHEFCHLKHMNHGPKFKALLHSFFTDYERRENTLKAKAKEYFWLLCK